MNEPASIPRRQSWLAPCAAALIVALVYAATAAPCAWWGDGMELTVAATSLGIAHPTGYPIYTLLGHVWLAVAKLLAPALDPGRAMTLFSAALMMVSVGLLARLFAKLGKNFEFGRATESRATSPIAAMAMAIAVGIAATAWEHATFAEVYPLTFLCVGLILCAVWRVPTVNILRRAALLGLLVGLGALNHYSLAACGPLVLLSLLEWGWPRRGARRYAPLARFLCVSTFVVACGWAYLVLRARANPMLNWGDPSSLARLRWVLTGGQFRGLNVTLTPEMALGGLARWLRWWGAQWMPARIVNPSQMPLADELLTPQGFMDGARLRNAFPAMLVGFGLIGLAFVGLAQLARRRKIFAIGLMGIIAMTAFFGAVYHIPDIDAFFLPALPAAMIGYACAAELGLGALRRRRPEALSSGLAHALPLIAVLLLVPMHFGEHNKSWDDGALVWGERAMAALPPDAIVLTSGDADIYALWYQQLALGKRPDVSIVGANFINQGWYARYFERPGRPAIAMRATDDPLPQKNVYDAHLLEWILMPNLRAGRRIFLTFQDPTLQALLSPTTFNGTGPFLPPSYSDLCAYEFALPPWHLWELHANPELFKLSDTELEKRIAAFYRDAAR